MPPSPRIPLNYLGEMTTAQRNALPVEHVRQGNCLFNLTASQMEVYDGAAWVSFIGSGFVSSVDVNSSGTPISGAVNLAEGYGILQSVAGQDVTTELDVDAPHIKYPNQLTESILAGEELTLSVTSRMAGAVRIAELNYSEIIANLDGEYYTVPAGEIDLNNADVALPEIHYIYVELVGGVPTVLQSTINPHVPGAECEYSYVSMVKLTSIGGVLTIYYARRGHAVTYTSIHHMNDYDTAIPPRWVNGFDLTVDDSTGEVTLAEGYAVRITRDLPFLGVVDGTILLDDYTTVDNLEDIDTYSDGSPITPGKYHKLLLGAVVAKIQADYKILVIRQAPPTAEYTSLEEARIDTERRAALMFGGDWLSNVVPVAYVEMLLGDASDLQNEDLRESGVYGQGGGGVPVTNHSLLMNLGIDTHPQYLRSDGSWTLTGDMLVTPGKKIDGYDVSVVGGLAHTQSHAITDAGDHTSAATPGKVLQADGNGLPINATNTDAQVAAAVVASHARAHAMDSAPDHSAGTRGDVLYAGAGGAWAKLPAGTAGQKLTTQAAIADPTWTDGQSQNMNFNQGSNTVGPSAVTYYQANALSTNIDQCQLPVVLGGSPVIKKLVVNVTTNTRPNNTTITVIKNGAVTGIAVIIPGGGTGVFASAGAPVACAQGDRIVVQIVTGATAGTLSRSSVAVLITN